MERVEENELGASLRNGAVKSGLWSSSQSLISPQGSQGRWCCPHLFIQAWGLDLPEYEQYRSSGFSRVLRPEMGENMWQKEERLVEHFCW